MTENNTTAATENDIELTYEELSAAILSAPITKVSKVMIDRGLMEECEELTDDEIRDMALDWFDSSDVAEMTAIAEELGAYDATSSWNTH